MGYVALRSAVKILAITTTLLAGGPAAADTLRIGGTGAALGNMILLAEAYKAEHPGTVIEVLPSLGSGGGIKALLAQAIDLGLSARPLKETEIAGGAVSEPYANTTMAFVTSADNDVLGITTEDLEAIYSGATTHWPNGEPIRVVMRPATEMATQALRGFSEETHRAVDVALARPGLLSATTDQENADILERLPGSFGLVSIGQIKTEKRQLKILLLNGMVPTASRSDGPENVFFSTLYLVSTKTASPLAAEFRNFVFSDAARAILSAHGFNPVE